MKRLLASLLACALILGSVPAFAEDAAAMQSPDLAPASSELSDIETDSSVPVAGDSEENSSGAPASEAEPAQGDTSGSSAPQVQTPASDVSSSSQAVSGSSSVPAGSDAANSVSSSDNSSASSEAGSSSSIAASSASEMSEEEIDALYTANDKITAFIQKMYRDIMGRDGDPEGMYYWVSGLSNRTLTCSDVVYHFLLDCREIKDRNLNDNAYVTAVYQTVFQRTPDPEGLAFWVDMLDQGVSRHYVVKMMAGTAEFGTLCNNLGILKGQLPATTQARDKDIASTSFIQRFYKLIMGRNGDEEGLNFWLGQLQSGAMKMSHVLIHWTDATDQCPEFRAIIPTEKPEKNDTTYDQKYVEILYRTLMGREPDPAGLSYWVKRLNSPYIDRQYILTQFFYSPEFVKQCKDAHLAQGSLTPGLYLNRNYDYTMYVVNLLQSTRGIKAMQYLPTRTDVNSAVATLVKNERNGVSLAAQYFFTSNMLNSQQVSDYEYFEALLKALWNRPRASEDPSINNTIYWQQYEPIIRRSRKEAFNTAANDSACIKYFSDKQIPWARAQYSDKLKVTINKTIVEKDLLDLLTGICRAEVGDWYNYPEVIKAQAIAAHSMILYNHQHGTAAPVVNYKSANDSVQSTIRKAVEQVLNTVVMYKNAPALTPYFSHTAHDKTYSAKEAWNSQDFPYLQAVASQYDYLGRKAGTSNKQTVTIDDKQMEAILNTMYNSDGKYPIRLNHSWAKALTVYSKDSAGHIQHFLANISWRGDNGALYTNAYPSCHYFWLCASKTLGANFFPSPTITDMKYNGNYKWTFTFAGTNTAVGGGVGLSQWGAYGYNRYQQWNYDTILKYYFPGTTLVTDYMG